MSFIRGYDWEGEEKPAAMVFLATKYRIRLTDPEKNPVKGGRCRVAADPDGIYPCDENGIAEIPLKDRSIKTLELEWEGEGSEGPFPWSNTFDVEIPTAQDGDCEKRLNHLGFDGESLSDKVSQYQDFFGLPATGNLADIQKDLVFWHDGGSYPSPLGAKSPESSAGASASPAKPADGPDPGDPSWSRDVMIVPDDAAGATNGVYAENIKFAKQWVKFNPAERAILQVGSNGSFEDAVTAAAAMAKKGKSKGGASVAHKIILFIGHGGDFDAKDPVHTMTTFDTLPEPGKFNTHTHRMTGDSVHLGKRIQSGEAVVVNYDIDNLDIRDKGSTVRSTDDPNWPFDELTKTKYLKYLELFRISKILKANAIEQFIVLSCSVGGDDAFVVELAGILGTKVGMYKRKVATEEVGSNGLIQIWLCPHDAKTIAERRVGKPKLTFDAKDRPKQHESLHEYPAPEISK